MIQGKLSFKVATIVDDDNTTANINLAKQRILYEDWAKLQKCHHCGAQGHVQPQCKKYIADIGTGKVQPVCFWKPATKAQEGDQRGVCDRFKSPRMKALLSAFAAFATGDDESDEEEEDEQDK
jgi:hypothetical protein